MMNYLRISDSDTVSLEQFEFLSIVCATESELDYPVEIHFR